MLKLYLTQQIFEYVNKKMNILFRLVSNFKQNMILFDFIWFKTVLNDTNQYNSFQSVL